MRKNEIPNILQKRMIGANFIGGSWIKTRSELEVLNPSTNEQIAFVPVATKEEMDIAVDAATEAFKTWGNDSKWSRVKRAEVIDDMVQLVKAHQEDIVTLMALECGKTLNECHADVTEGIHMLQYCAGMGRQPIGLKVASEIADKESEVYPIPRGVCTVITPWNFPFAIPTWLIGPALVSGNPVVFKPSEETPLTGQFLVDLFNQAAKKHAVPRGVLNLVHGGGEVGEYLVRHEGTVGQLFTGSSPVGSKIKQIAAAHHDKFAVCEMGGKNSLIVLRDADMELAVNAAILSAYRTTHQRCVSADLLIIEETVEHKFTKRFLEITRRIKFGDPFDPTVFAGPLINQGAVRKYLRHGNIVSQEAETLRWLSPPQDGNFVGPNIFRMKYRPNTFALRQEAFTPNIVIVPVHDLDEALLVANDNDGCLSMAIITKDQKKQREFKLRKKSGLGYVNLPTVGAEVHLPFSGVKGGGTGMPSAAWLFKYMCHETAFTINYGDEIKMAQGLSAKV